MRVCILCLVASILAQVAPGPGPPQSEEPRVNQVEDSALLPLKSDTAPGLMNLDVMVTNKSGLPISDLGSQDFVLLDNGKPTKILSCQRFDQMRSYPVKLILVVDTLNLPLALAAFERDEVGRFLRGNRGHLDRPISVYGLSAAGVWKVAQPSNDGNTLATEIARNKFDVIRRRGLGEDEAEGVSALKALADIATVERGVPGRKLLVWVGPGWGLGSGVNFISQQPRLVTFRTIYWFSTLLREARIVLYTTSVGQTAPDLDSLKYLSFLNGVASVELASVKNLDKRVLAIESGGRVLPPTNDLVSQINSCVREAGIFYELSFDPPASDHPGEYHRLNVRVSKPDSIVRTTTGYYDSPYYSDQPNVPSRRVNVEQLEQLLLAARGEPDARVAKQISDLELTERLSSTELSSWKSRLHGKKARQALVALADRSAFLDPPQAEIVGKAPPDPVRQQLITSLAIDYLDRTIPSLPNLFATRTMILYQETPRYDEQGTHTDYQPLHVVASSKSKVFYRNGQEVVDSSTEKRIEQKTEEGDLITYGTFGPLLRAVKDAIASGLTWVRWERGIGGVVAVFRYEVPAELSHYQVGACCVPYGNGTGAFEEPGYHGQIEVDPTSGAILRMELIADMKSTTPLARSDIVIEYGAVEIGRKMYTCPTRSLSISRGRSVISLTEWNDSFKTYGPYATMLNDVDFSRYHIFRTESHIRY